jgi:NAD(P)-dependent dehydrogenase (short-subunit alcohol dehydrogenase family)
MTPTNSPSRIALITGGSRGLGRSTALKLAEAGRDLIFTYQRNEADAHALVREIEGLGRRAVALQLDLGLPKTFPAFGGAVRAALSSTWGRERFDFLVNNAGVGAYALLADATEEQFDLLCGVHLKGTFFLTQALLPLIADGGRIVNISSGLARFSLPGYGVYAMMKGGLEVMTRYLAVELGPRRIAVNTIAPGAIETDFGGGTVRDDPKLNALIAGQTALGRVGLPEDIGGAITALLDDGNRWVNAQRIEVSGGIHV